MKRLLVALAAALSCLCALPALAQSSGQINNGRQQFINGAGSPLANGTVSIYQAGTSTPVSTYQNSGLTIANPWPIVLDSNGAAAIWLAPGQYREVVQDSFGNTLWDTMTGAPSTDVLPWQSYTPGIAPTPDSGAFGSVSYPSAQYMRLNKTIWFQISVFVASVGTAANCLTVGLPVQSAITNTTIASSFGNSAGTIGAGAINGSMTTTRLCTGAGTSPWSGVDHLNITGFYQAAQ